MPRCMRRSAPAGTGSCRHQTCPRARPRRCTPKKNRGWPRWRSTTPPAPPGRVKVWTALSGSRLRFSTCRSPSSRWLGRTDRTLPPRSASRQTARPAMFPFAITRSLATGYSQSPMPARTRAFQTIPWSKGILASGSMRAPHLSRRWATRSARCASSIVSRDRHCRRPRRRC